MKAVLIISALVTVMFTSCGRSSGLTEARQGLPAYNAAVTANVNAYALVSSVSSVPDKKERIHPAAR